MSIFKRIIKAVRDEIDKPQSFVKGEAFEEYVRKYVFSKEYYKILRRTQNYQVNNVDYVADSLLPDFEFECLETGKSFHVEVKFRNGELNFNDKIEWCKPYQLERYQQIDKEKDVFVILGIGDNPKKPEELIIFPLKACKFTGLYNSFLDKYSFPYLEKPVFPKYLWKLK